MNRIRLRRILCVALLNVAVVMCASARPLINLDAESAQADRRTTGGNSNSASGRNKVADANKDDDKLNLTDAEARLVAGSKQAILETGISKPYFEEHFRLIKVVNQSGDRRVVWEYSINGYEATVNDAVGYYTAEDGARVDTHSIKQMLGSTRDIEKTISRKRAETIMRRCIGNYTNPSIVFRSFSAPGGASLYMVASSASTKRDVAEKREEEERRKREREKKTTKNKAAETDTLREEDDEGEKPSYYGVVNLETGKCAKGRAIIAP
jgi:hypothetical protein